MKTNPLVITFKKRDLLRRLSMGELIYLQQNRIYSTCGSCGKISHEYNYCIVCVHKGKHIKHMFVCEN